MVPGELVTARGGIEADSGTYGCNDDRRWPDPSRVVDEIIEITQTPLFGDSIVNWSFRHYNCDILCRVDESYAQLLLLSVRDMASAQKPYSP